MLSQNPNFVPKLLSLSQNFVPLALRSPIGKHLPHFDHPNAYNSDLVVAINANNYILCILHVFVVVLV